MRSLERDLVAWLKSLALSIAPDEALLRAKKIRYPRLLRSFDISERTVLQALISPGDHVLDLGANAGWYTKILSELVGVSGHVYSVEPVPLTYELLSYCVKQLGLHNVTLFNCAVSDCVGSAVMEIPLYQAGGENFYEARIVGQAPPLEGLRRVTVPLRSVDSLFLELPDEVGFIKADVEGHELAVLRGARGIIQRSLPAMYVEVTSDPDEPTCPAAALIGYLDGEGYRPYWFDGRGLVGRQPGQRSVNYFFLTVRHLDALEHAKISVC